MNYFHVGAGAVMNNKLDSSLGIRIRFCRDTARLSQEALAGRLGVTQRTIIKWEKDETIPKLPVLKEISEITGFHYEWINEGKGEERKPKETIIKSGEEEEVLRNELMAAQRKIISLMEENASLKDELLKKSIPLSKKNKA